MSAAGSEQHGTLRVGVLSLLGAWTIRTLRATLRLRFHGESEIRARERQGRPFILAFWHRHMLLMRYAYRGSRMNVLSSRSRDGELMVRVLGRLGVRASRGSSSRGGAAGLRDLIRQARAGWDLGITPDGPRGPARVVQPGIVHAAAATGLPVIPVALAAHRQRELRTWDRTVVPLPFSRVEIVAFAIFCAFLRGQFTPQSTPLEQTLRFAMATRQRSPGNDTVRSSSTSCPG